MSLFFNRRYLSNTFPGSAIIDSAHLFEKKYFFIARVQVEAQFGLNPVAEEDGGGLVLVCLRQLPQTCCR